MELLHQHSLKKKRKEWTIYALDLVRSGLRFSNIHINLESRFVVINETGVLGRAKLGGFALWGGSPTVSSCATGVSWMLSKLLSK